MKLLIQHVQEATISLLAMAVRVVGDEVTSLQFVFIIANTTEYYALSPVFKIRPRYNLKSECYCGVAKRLMVFIGFPTIDSGSRTFTW